MFLIGNGNKSILQISIAPVYFCGRNVIVVDGRQRWGSRRGIKGRSVSGGEKFSRIQGRNSIDFTILIIHLKNILPF
jgi:hypothetical protein